MLKYLVNVKIVKLMELYLLGFVKLIESYLLGSTQKLCAVFSAL